MRYGAPVADNWLSIQYSSIVLEGINMERIQKLFELLAGISAEEDARLARAKAIFADNAVDVSTLHIPACWRRKQRVSR